MYIYIHRVCIYMYIYIHIQPALLMSWRVPAGRDFLYTHRLDEPHSLPCPCFVYALLLDLPSGKHSYWTWPIYMIYLWKWWLSTAMSNYGCLVTLFWDFFEHLANNLPFRWRSISISTDMSMICSAEGNFFKVYKVGKKSWGPIRSTRESPAIWGLLDLMEQRFLAPMQTAMAVILKCDNGPNTLNGYRNGNLPSLQHARWVKLAMADSTNIASISLEWIMTWCPTGSTMLMTCYVVTW